jgi:hypothetical protein
MNDDMNCHPFSYGFEKEEKKGQARQDLLTSSLLRYLQDV